MIENTFENCLNRFLNHALRPYLLRGKLAYFFWVLVICLVLWCLVSLRLYALVSLVLKKMALFPEPWWRFPAAFDLSFSLRIVRFRAIFFLTPLILESFVALPEDALAFLRVLSSSLSFSMFALMVWESLSLIFLLICFYTIVLI